MSRAKYLRKCRSKMFLLFREDSNCLGVILSYFHYLHRPLIEDRGESKYKVQKLIHAELPKNVYPFIPNDICAFNIRDQITHGGQIFRSRKLFSIFVHKYLFCLSALPFVCPSVCLCTAFYCFFVSLSLSLCLNKNMRYM